MLSAIYSAEIEKWNNSQNNTEDEKDSYNTYEYSTSAGMPDLDDDIFRDGSAKLEYSECF